MPAARRRLRVHDGASPYVTETTCRFAGLDVDNVDEGTHALRLMGGAASNLTRREDDWDRGSRAQIVQARRALEGRRHEGRNDILTRIVQAIDEGEMPEQVALATVVTLLSAGQIRRPSSWASW